MSVEPLKHFAIVLPAVADMMDEQHLSTDECMAALREFLGEAEQPVEVREAIARLEDIEDEGEFRYMLGQESLRAVKRKD